MKGEGRRRSSDELPLEDPTSTLAVIVQIHGLGDGFSSPPVRFGISAEENEVGVAFSNCQPARTRLRPFRRGVRAAMAVGPRRLALPVPTESNRVSRSRRDTLVEQRGIRARTRVIDPDAVARECERVAGAVRGERIADVVHADASAYAVVRDQPGDIEGAADTVPGPHHKEVTGWQAHEGDGQVGNKRLEILPLRGSKQGESRAVA